MRCGKSKKIIKLRASFRLSFWNNFVLIFMLVLGSSGILQQSWAFSDQACLMQDFEVSITQPSKFLQFLMPTISLKKAACELTIEKKRWKWAKTWIVDVCRGPVHIKFQNFRSAAWMKKASCYGQEKSDQFCRGYQQIMQLIQEDGLIYAPGERDDLSSDHGKTYCLYLLAKSYLDEGKLFSRHASYNPPLTRDQAWGAPSGGTFPTGASVLETPGATVTATAALEETTAATDSSAENSVK